MGKGSRHQGVFALEMLYKAKLYEGLFCVGMVGPDLVMSGSRWFLTTELDSRGGTGK